jgi:hypothetical protein
VQINKNQNLMKFFTILFLTCLLCFPLKVDGQSIVIDINTVFQLGDETVIAICDNVVEPGPAGVNQTWDMTHLVESEEQSFEYVDPEDTPWGEDFSDATICGISWDNSFSYYEITPQGVSVIGYAGYLDEEEEDYFKMSFTEAEHMIPFPFEYQDVHTDDFAGSFEVMGFTGSFTGDLDFEVDGYGTLILPNGTFHNVVRYRFFRTQTNVVGGQPSTQTKEQWGWMSPEFSFWLMIMEVTNDGFSDSHLVWYAKNPKPVNTANIETIEVNVFPNPHSISGNLQLDWNKQESAEVILSSMDGRTVYTSKMELHEGSNNISLLNANLSTGLYMLSIQTETTHGTTSLMLIE